MAAPFDFSSLVAALVPSAAGIPQTQQDINVLAQTAKQFQAPDVQARLTQLEAQLSTYAKTQLMLQAIGTIAMVGLFVLSLRKDK